jgi:hypothetical protein
VVLEVRELDHTREPAFGSSCVSYAEGVRLEGLSWTACEESYGGQLGRADTLRLELRYRRIGVLEQIMEEGYDPGVDRYGGSDPLEVRDEERPGPVTLVAVIRVSDCSSAERIHRASALSVPRPSTGRNGVNTRAPVVLTSRAGGLGPGRGRRAREGVGLSLGFAGEGFRVIA